MARINTNIPSVVAQANLVRNQADLNLRLERLSTGLRINRGADDPAGLIISERIRSDIAGVDQGIKNSDRASSVISTTESALAEVNDLLNSVRSLIVESANTGAVSAEERRANQLQIDSAIESITRISNTASFGGLKLLDGSLDYRLSGIAASAITIAQIRNASFINNTSLNVQVDVIGSAQVGSLYYQGTGGGLQSAMNIEVKGPDGVQILQFQSGASLTDVVNAVNQIKAFTGVEASLINSNPASGMVFKTVAFGTDSIVSVRRVNGPADGSNSFRLAKFRDDAPIASGAPFDWSGLFGAGSLISGVSFDAGKDVSALVNGNLATGRGLNLSVNSPALGLDLEISRDFAIRPSENPSTFTIAGGGALFQLGPEVTALQQSTMGIPSVAASRLGATLTSQGTVDFLSSLKTGQFNSLDAAVKRNDFSDAQNILQAAIDEVTGLRGRLGAFERNVLDTNVRSLQAQYENLSASESRIRDADFAFETSRLTRGQILVQAGTATLQLANQQSQQVLQLLG